MRWMRRKSYFCNKHLIRHPSGATFPLRGRLTYANVRHALFALIQGSPVQGELSAKLTERLFFMRANSTILPPHPPFVRVILSAAEIRAKRGSNGESAVWDLGRKEKPIRHRADRRGRRSLQESNTPTYRAPCSHKLKAPLCKGSCQQS